MFTGIVEEVGTVKSLQSGKLVISAKKVLAEIVPGDSIAVNGACLTATAFSNDIFSVDVMPETLRRTNLGALLPGDRVNLERALAASGRFGGHFVQGHIDGTGMVESIVPEGDALMVKVSAPSDITRYLVEKGYIAVDGVSLTIVNCDARSFTVSLVRYSQEHTSLKHRRPGDVVNLEVDIMAKYLERLRWGEGSRITLEFLDEHGFLAA